MLVNASVLANQYLFVIKLELLKESLKLRLPFGVPIVFSLNIPGLSVITVSPVTELEAITIERNSTSISANPELLEDNKEYKTVQSNKKISFEVRMPSTINTTVLTDLAFLGGANVLSGGLLGTTVGNATASIVGETVPNPFILPFKMACEYLYDTSKEKFVADQLAGYASIYGTGTWEEGLFLTGYRHSQSNSNEIFNITLERQPKSKSVEKKIVGS